MPHTPNFTIVYTLDELMRLFDFTDDDLTANRAGRLSPRQRARIEQEMLTSSIFQVAALAALTCACALIILYFVIAIRFSSDLGPTVLIVIVLWLVSTWVIVRGVFTGLTTVLGRFIRRRDHWLLRRFGRMGTDREQIVAEGVVAMTRGVLHRVDDGEHQYLSIGDGDEDEQAFTSPLEDIDERLRQIALDREYVFYYLPKLLWITAVEPLSTQHSGEE